MKRILFVLIFFSVQKSFCEQSSEDPYTPLKTFAESLHLIEKHYPKKVKRDQLISGAIKGMLFELDPYSHFMTYEEAKVFQRQSKSRYGGIGIEVAFQKQKIIVTSVFKDSPAFKAGVQVGDIITHIKGQSIEKLSFDTAAQKMRGKIGETMTLQVLREDQKKSFSLTLKKVRIPSIIGIKISKNFFYVRILSFRDSTFKDLKKILKKEFQNIPKGLLIDIRQNSGGIVDQALLSADLFVSEGLLIVIRSRNSDQKRTFRAKKLGTFPSTFPIVVLMDRYSASASEIFASALQDNRRAVLLGEKSFGKGSIQSVFDVEPHGTLKLTVAHYYSPQGRVIEQKGIEPDIKIPLENYRSVIKKFKKKFYSVPTTNQKNPKWIPMEKDSQLRDAFTVLSELSAQ